MVWSDYQTTCPRTRMQTASKTEFGTIRKNKIYEEVARRIERLILQKMRPGDKLPAERELAEMFGVSRSSIRDAMRSLELVGLVEPRQGAGTVVREVSVDLLLTPLSNVIAHKRQLISELLDFRKMLEPPLAARAAHRATGEEIAELEEILRRQSDKLLQGELAIEEDSEFHYSIAMASGNTVVLKLLDVVMDLLRETRAQSLQREGRPLKSLAGHRRILAAIRKRDEVTAESAMRQHIQDIERIVSHELSTKTEVFHGPVIRDRNHLSRHLSKDPR